MVWPLGNIFVYFIVKKIVHFKACFGKKSEQNLQILWNLDLGTIYFYNFLKKIRPLCIFNG